MRYFAEFNNVGKRTAGWFADGMPFSAEEIIAQHPNAVELDENEQKLYLMADRQNAPFGYRRDMNTGLPIKCAMPVPTLASARAVQLELLNKAAADEYVSGFYSSASGTNLYYDSDTETQALLSSILQRTKEADWETKVRYPDVAPAGKAPVRARPSAESASSAKTVQLLDAAQIKTLIDDLEAAFFATKTKLWSKQAPVAAAATVAEVQAVTW